MTADEDRGQRRAPRRTRLPAAQRRETILRAAVQVFAEAGYRAAKVSDVARRVGVTEPVIFQNFGSKAALFAAVVEYAAAEASTWLDNLDADHGPALLAHVLSGTTAPAGSPEPGGHRTPDGHPGPDGHPAAAYGVLFADAAALAADPELSEPSRAAVRAVAGHLADLIRRGQAENGFPATGPDPEAAAWLLLSLLAARRLREAAMPPELEPAVAALALRALGPAAHETPRPGAPSAANLPDHE